MGRVNHDQEQLFYSFCLEDAVPDDHLVRAIAGVLDLSWVHAELAPHYSEVGRPSIDPVLMIRMLLIGYVFAIRSERALCREVQVNLAYRWFCGLSIEDKVPDHSAFSRVRNERFRGSDIFRTVFERVVEACIRAGLVGGEGFAVDASLIVADANKQRSIPGAKWSKELDPQGASRAAKEYLARLDDAAFGAASSVTPKFESSSDPAAQWTGAMRGPAFFAYSDKFAMPGPALSYGLCAAWYRSAPLCLGEPLVHGALDIGLRLGLQIAGIKLTAEISYRRCLETAAGPVGCFFAVASIRKKEDLRRSGFACRFSPVRAALE
jgi:transposase